MIFCNLTKKFLKSNYIILYIQGYSLIAADFDNTNSSRSTWQYGIVTIAINWLPGFIGAIHIMAMYRHNYSAANTISAAGEMTMISYSHNE